MLLRYDKSFYAMGGMMVVATVAHSLVIPYVPKSAIEEEIKRNEEKVLDTFADRRDKKKSKRKVDNQ